MAARGSSTMEEAIRLVLQTEGREGVDALRDALSRVGDVSVETQQETAGLIDNLVELNETAAKAARYGELTAELERSQAALDQASQSAYQLTLELGNAEKPSRELVRAQKAAREEVQRLEGAVTKQWQALERADTELGSLGLNTADFSQAQADLRNNLGRTTAAVADQVKVVEKQSAAQRQLRERMEEGDDKFRKFARSGTAAAESLDAYRGRAAAARDETARVAKEADGASGVFGRLRGVVAGVFGFFSARSLIGGLKSIVTEGSNAEQELAQINAALASTGRQAEFAGDELAALADRLARTSNFAAGDITNAQTRLLSYTNILRTEFPDALQVVIDQSARLGISLEQSAEIVGRSLQEPTKAMQALGRQGFVLEESQKQLLAQLEATGRTAEAQRIIMDLLVESYGGAAAAQKIGTIAGLWKAVSESYKDFQTQIAQAGVLDYFKSQLAELLEISGRMARDGQLAHYARNVSEAIVGVAQAVRSATSFLYEHRGSLILLAKAYAALKIGQAVIAMNAWRIAQIAAARKALTHASALDATAGAATRFGRVIRAIPTSIKIGIALVGVELAIKGAREFGEWVGKSSEASEHAAKVSEQVREQMRLEAVERASLAAGLSQYRDQAVLSAEQVATLSESEREAYEQRLVGLQDYLKAQIGYLIRQKELGVATQEQIDQLGSMPSRLASVRNGFNSVAEGAALAGRALEQGVGPAAAKISERLREVQNDAKLGQQRLSELFQSVNFRDNTALGDLASGIALVAQESEGAAIALRDGLIGELRKLTADELARFQAGGQAAFSEFGIEAQGAAAVLNASLFVSMEKLGVSAENIGLGFSVMGQEAVRAFGTVVENANATAAQIETAFTAALARAATQEEIEQLGVLLKSAGEQGKIGFEAAERAAAALANRVGEVKNAIDPLNDSFRRLGITSKAELDRARDAAKDAFHQIRQAAGRGEAAIEDVRAAAQRYGEAMRAAAANSDASMRQRVESEIRVMEQIFRVNDGLDEMANAGTRAGEAVAGGAGRAASALQDTSGAAAQAASSLDDVAAAGGKVGQGNGQVEDSAKRAGFALGGMSDAAFKALMAMNRYAASPRLWVMGMNRVLGEISAQNEAVQNLTRSYDAQTNALDPQMQQLEQLRQTYKYVTDEQLRAMAASKAAFEERKRQIAEEKQAAQDEAKRKRQEQVDALQAQAGEGGGSRVQSNVKTVIVRMQLDDGDSMDFSVDATREQDAINFARRLGRSRARSTGRRG